MSISEIRDLKIQFNKNYFGLSVDSSIISNLVIYPNQSTEVKIPVEHNILPDYTKIPESRPPIYIETALASSLDEFYFNIPLLFCVLFVNVKSQISKEDYLSNWKNITTTNDMCSSMNNVHSTLRNAYNLEKKFKNYNIYLIHKGENEKQIQLFFYSQVSNGQLALMCVYLSESNPEINIVAKCESPFLINHIMSSVRYLLVNEN